MEAKFLLIWKSKYFLGDRAFPHMIYLDAQNMGAAEVAAFDHLKRSYGNEPNFLGGNLTSRDIEGGSKKSERQLKQ